MDSTPKRFTKWQKSWHRMRVEGLRKAKGLAVVDDHNPSPLSTT